MKPKPITNKTIYNPYVKEKCFHQPHQTNSEEQSNMKEYLDKRKTKHLKTLPLKCSNCNFTFTIKPTSKESIHFIQHYGTINKAKGSLHEINCPLCIGVMEKL